MHVNLESLQDAVGIANTLSVQPSTVLAMARDGRIPSVRISHRCVRFDLQEVLSALRGDEGVEDGSD